MKDKNKNNTDEKFEKNKSKKDISKLNKKNTDEEINPDSKSNVKNTDLDKDNVLEKVDKHEEELADEIITLSKDFKESIEKIESLQKENEELKDKLLRSAAEFENFKRRNENERLNFMKYAAESFLLKILPIYDDLIRSNNHIEDENNIASIKDGLKNILEKFSKTLDEQGVKIIEAKGKKFDFNFHEALMQKEDNTVPPHTVIEEIEPGYTYNDKVIRHTKVIVSQEMTGTSNEKDGTDNSENQNNENKEK